MLFFTLLTSWLLSMLIIFLFRRFKPRRWLARVTKLETFIYFQLLAIVQIYPIKHSVNHVFVQTWHYRLGHLSNQRLDLLKEKLPCTSSKIHRSSPCYVCPLAKQRKLSFVSHHNKSEFPFDLVHCDIWGPYSQLSYSSYQYFLTLVDDCTRFTWIYLLKQKSDVSSIIPKFFTMV